MNLPHFDLMYAFNHRVPKIDDETLAERFLRIQPIVRDEDGVAWFIEEVDPSSIAFTWAPVLREKAPGDLVPLMTCTVYVTWAYYGCFKPTIRECLAQIPDHAVDFCVAFEIVKRPETREHVFHDLRVLNAGYHACEVTYYGASPS